MTWSDGDLLTPTNLENKSNAPVFNVKDFGAVGDGSTDDTAAIQLAIDTAATQTNGGVVYLTAGEFHVTSTIEGDRTVSIVGAGPHHSIIKGDLSNDTADILDLRFPSDNHASELVFAKFSVQGQGQGNAQERHGINYENGHQILFDQIEVADVDEVAFRCGPGTWRTNWIGCSFVFSRIGLELVADSEQTSANASAFFGGRLSSNNRGLVIGRTGPSFSVANFALFGTTIEGNIADGVQADKIVGLRLEGCYLEQNVDDQLQLGLFSGDCDSVVLRDCYFDVNGNNGNQGIEVDQCNHLWIEGCTFVTIGSPDLLIDNGINKLVMGHNRGLEDADVSGGDAQAHIPRHLTIDGPEGFSEAGDTVALRFAATSNMIEKTFGEGFRWFDSNQRWRFVNSSGITQFEVEGDGITIDRSSKLHSGSGAPSDENGNNGDFFFRDDGAGGTALYYKSGGTWSAIA